ncbi:GON-4-like protein isoform X3 [Macrotis lagotis]|uniref:GON-4-like protein isoform X3 n=1 Tax=Macrotis lagotis TaxID=92651 RepID=UPI003D680BD3
MLPCKKRRTTLISSPQHKDSQEETQLESTTTPEPDHVAALGTVSLPWGLSHVRTPGLDVQPMQDVDDHTCKEEPSASRLLVQDTNVEILEAIDVSSTQEINLPSLESSQSCNILIAKGKIQGTCMKRGKRIALRPGPAPRDDHPNWKDSSPSAEACEKINNESGKPPMQSEVEESLQQVDSSSIRLGTELKKSSQPGGFTSQEKQARTPAHQNEEEMEDIGLFIPLEQDGEEGEKRRRKKKATKRKRDGRSQEEGGLTYDLKLDDMLDRTLEDGAKQHNLTVVNVRNILHEVITNEHVVAMMKAAISETDDLPVFEPKMTRSKLKEVVEKGVVIPTWNISPIKKANEIKPPQFVDIPLEEDDSSDEEYQPEDEEEDETAEESLLESDVESTASSPRGSKRSRMRQSSELTETDEEGGILSEVEKITTPPIRHISAEVVPMGPPPPPKPKQNKDSTFMEKLHAVDEELACSPVCMDSFQPLDDSLIAFRTRSKMPLKDVPLGQLEAELRAPDITPDMYDPNTADDEDWKMWLGGLMNDDVENEDEADDDDDPEYNFLEDRDEPDTEDFRNDRAVRITKKEVNELMEELFETFQDEMGFSNMEDEGPEEEDSVTESRPNFNTPQALRFEEPLANLLNEQHRTVKELLEQLRMKKSSTKQQPEAERTKPQSDKAQQTLILDAAQRKRLQQQMQQHVQLLTQIHLLSSANPSLSSEANTTKMFLRELGTFAQSSVVLHHQFNPKFQTMFQPCNLKGAMQLIEDFHSHIHIDWSPRKNVKKSASEFPCLPKQVAWILATSKVFMYPELLPICSLKAKNPRDKIFFTKAEDNLLALGLKHFEGTEFPKPLISKYLLTAKSAHQLTVRIKNLNINRAPDNIIKYYKKTKQLPILFKCCEELQPDQWKPPVEREERHLPFWLKETMEKLTWLASERRMSQEGDSEEENSQEENSEPEEEEEEEVLEGMEILQKEDEMMDEATGGPAEKPPSTFASPKITPEVETSRIPPGENNKTVGKTRSSHRTRSKRGRSRASKDTSKLLLLYDEDILERDPLREQKDLAFAQAYLTRVREALHHVPGKYEDFLRVIYEFESSTQRRTAVDLYNSLQSLLRDWPQLLKDFAAFLLPEQALACGLFEEQQAFEKSRKFLRQLEICFAENPSHHQKIIKVLQGCADCLPQEIGELKTQMWQLLKGHDHLQDEFSVFFDHLRPVASRLGDFEEINWTEEKEYEFDGFEEVALPDVEEEEEHPKMTTASKAKRRKEIGSQNHDKETEWPDGPKDCVCSCHEGNPDPKLKKTRRRGCSHCSSKVYESKACKNKDPHELLGASPPPEASPTTDAKEAKRSRETGEEETLDEQDSRAPRAARKGEMPVPGLEMGETLLPPGEGNSPDKAPLDVPAPCSPESPQRSPKAGLVPNSIRSQFEAEGIQSSPLKLQTSSEAQQAGSMPGSGKLVAAAGYPASTVSPVSSNTTEVGKGWGSAQGKPDTSNNWLHPGRIPTTLESPPPLTTTSGTIHRVPIGGSSKEDSGLHIRGPDGEQQLKASEATVCANNSKVSSTGEKVVLWTREADRVILTMCQERGAQPQTFSTISQQLGNKTPGEVSHRFRELMQLFHTACEASSEEEDDATSTSNTDQLSDRGDLLSEEEPDE